MGKEERQIAKINNFRPALIALLFKHFNQWHSLTSAIKFIETRKKEIHKKSYDIYKKILFHDLAIAGAQAEENIEEQFVKQKCDLSNPYEKYMDAFQNQVNIERNRYYNYYLDCREELMELNKMLQRGVLSLEDYKKITRYLPDWRKFTD